MIDIDELTQKEIQELILNNTITQEQVDRHYNQQWEDIKDDWNEF